MAGLRKRSTAVIIAVAVIIIGTLFGVHRSVGSETSKIEAQFYDGVYLKEEKYTQPSIQSQLDKRADAALGLLSVGNKYAFAADAAELLRSARQELLDADAILEKYAANVKLEKAWKQLYETLAAHTGDLPASVDSYASTLGGAQGVIDKSDYNQSVTEFRSALGAFPVNILKNLAFVKYPEYFGTEG